MARIEAAYRWTGWVPGLLFLAMSRSAPNLWLGLALGLFGVCHFGHWTIERVEAVRGRKLMPARYAEAAVWFAVAPVLAIIGMVVWAWDGFPLWP
jgi:hypothetical protein